MVRRKSNDGVSTNPVALLVMLILDNEDHVKTRQDSGLEVDVLEPRVRQQRPLSFMRRCAPRQDFALRRSDPIRDSRQPERLFSS